MKKILFVTNMLPVPDYQYFGIHVKEQIESLTGSGGVNSKVYFLNGRASKLNYLKSLWKIPRMIRQYSPELIHVHYGISGLFLLFTRQNVPVILTLHSGEIYRKKSWFSHKLQKGLTLMIMRRSAKVIVLNDDMIDLLQDYREKLEKIPCGINTAFFKGEVKEADRKSLKIGFPGNKTRPEKNYALFLEITQLLQKKYDFQVVEFHNMTRKEVVDNLNQLDVLCMTSTIEGSPQIIKEAMACNIPIVSTHVGDVEDLLRGVTNCQVIDSFDPDDFIQAIDRLFQLPNEARTTNGRNKITQMGLDLDSVKTQLLTVYNSLLHA